MPKFIIVSFGLMAWVFYELSGGADFKPPHAGEALMAQAQTTTAAPSASPATKSLLKQVREERALQASQPAKPEKLAMAKTPAPAGNPMIQPASLKVSEEASNSLRGLSQFEGEPLSQYNVASLRDVSATSDATVEEVAVRPAPEPEADLREIVATRVNMRAGPGTDNDIVDRLDRGHTVEVLENNGRGWLRLRALPEDRVGWIAARLVSTAD